MQALVNAANGHAEPETPRANNTIRADSPAQAPTTTAVLAALYMFPPVSRLSAHVASHTHLILERHA